MLRAVLRIAIRVVVVLVLVLAVAVLFRGPLFGGLLANAIAKRLSEAAGGTFTLDGVEGGWFSDLVLVGLRGEAGGARVAVQQVELAYDLRGLLGERPQDAISAVNVVDARVELDLARPPGPPGSPFDWNVLPPQLPALQLTGSLVLRTGRGTVTAGVVRADGGGSHVDFALDDVAVPDFETLPLITGRFEVGDRTWTVAASAAVVGGHASLRAAPGAVSGEFRDVDLARLRRDVAGRVTGTFDAARGVVRAEGAVEGLRHAELRADHVAFRGSLRDGRAHVETLDAASGEATVRAQGLVLDPDVPWAVVSAARVDVDVPDLRAWRPELDVPVRLTVRAASPDGRRVVVEEARIESAGTDLLLRGSAALDPDDWRRSELRLDGEGALGDLGRLAPDLPRIEGRIDVRGEVRGTAAEPRIDLRASGADLRVEGRAVRELRLDAVLAPPRMVVRSLRVFAEPGRVEAYGELDLDARRVRDGAFTLDVPDLRGFAAMFPRAPAVEGALQGAGKLEGAVARVSLRGSGLAIEGNALGAIELEADVREGLVDVTRLRAEGAWGTATVRGVAEPGARKGRIDVLTADVRGRKVALLVPARVLWDDSGAELVGLDLDAFGGRVTGHARFRGEVDVALVAEGVDLSTLSGELAGRLEASVTLRGADADVAARCDDLSYAGHRGSLALRALQDARGVSVGELALRAGDALRVDASGRVPWRLGPKGPERVEGGDAQVRVEATVADLARFSGLQGSASVSATGDGAGLRADVRLRDVVVPDGPRVHGESRVEVEILRDRASFSVRTEPGERGHVSGVLRADRGADWTQPGELRAALGDARVEGDLDLFLPTLALVRPLLPERIRLEGRGRGKLAFRGELLRPELDGFVVLEDLDGRFGPGFPAFREGRARVAFRERTLEIRECAGQVGHAPLSLAGTATLPEQGAPEVDLALKGTNVLLRRDEFLRVRADLDLALRGPLDALAATGEVVVTDALYTRPADLLSRATSAAERSLRLFSIRDGPFSATRFDIRVKADESFRWRNNLFRGDVSLDLALRGTGEAPEPQGRLFFRDTLVRLPLTSLKVDQGEVRFPPENPFAPEARVRAHTRMQGYDLDVEVRGTMPDFDVYVTTTPPMAQADAIVLLTTGATPEELERQGAMAAATRAGSYFGRKLVARWGGPSDPDEQGFLDRFEVTVGSDVSRRGDETVLGEFEVNPRWFLRAERDRFDDYNFGVVWRLRFR